MLKESIVIVIVAIVCSTVIALYALFELTNDSAKEVVMLTVTAIFSAISGGGIGYTVGKTGFTNQSKNLIKREEDV